MKQLGAGRGEMWLFKKCKKYSPQIYVSRRICEKYPPRIYRGIHETAILQLANIY